MRLVPAVATLLLIPAWLSAAPLTFRTLAGPAAGGGYADGRQARFSAPHAIATDSAGNVYVADSGNSTIRRIAPNGTVSTLAGNGRSGSSDDAGAAASFQHPRGLDLAPDGALIVADTENARIRRVAMDGTVTTIAGTSWGTADGALHVAQFTYPRGVAVDAAGTIYVADAHAVRKIDSAGVTTLAGQVTEAGLADGPGTAALFRLVSAVTVGPDGMLYVADTLNRLIRRVTPEGDVSTVVSVPAHPTALRFDAAGVLWIGAIGDLFRLTPLGAIASVPVRGNVAPWTFSGVAFDAFGGVLLADTTHHAIRRWSSPGDVTTVAGSPVVAGSVDGPAAVARFLGPVPLAADAHGNVLVGDGSGIRNVAPSGFVTTLPYEFACAALAVDANGRIACSTGSEVRVFAPSGSITAGHALQRGYVDGPGTTARFGLAHGLAADAQGNIYVADYDNHVVRRIDVNGVVTTHAGTGSAGSRDGTRQTAQFNYPSDLVLDQAGALYVLDNGGSRIRSIAPDGTVATVPCRVATTPHCFPSARRFTRDVDGTFYVASQFAHVIYRLTRAGDVEIVGGLRGAPGNVPGVGDEARFDDPRGIAVTSDGRLVVASSGANTIHVATLPPVIDRFIAESTSEGTRLTWSAHYATAAAIDGVGAVAVSGTVIVAGRGPFRLTVTSGGGSATAMAGLGRRRAIRTH